MNAEAAGEAAFAAWHGPSERARTRAARIRRDEFILPLCKQNETPSRKTNGGSMTVPPTGRKALPIGCIPAIAQWRSAPLFPDREDCPHDEIANELIARIDGQELHAAFHEQRAGELHGGDEAEPHAQAQVHAVKGGINRSNAENF